MAEAVCSGNQTLQSCVNAGQAECHLPGHLERSMWRESPEALFKRREGRDVSFWVLQSLLDYLIREGYQGP